MTSRKQQEWNGYKFQFEYEFVIPQDPDDESGIFNKRILTTYGDTAKEAVENNDKLLDAWRTFLGKQARETPLDDEDKLK